MIFTAAKRDVLNHGFIRLIETMGTDICPEAPDTSIVGAARVSYGGGTKGAEADSKLLYYLYANRHTSPFEMCEAKFHIKAPIFVARQWVRHRTANWNEISGRYTELPEEYYIPNVWRTNAGVDNRQSSQDMEHDGSDGGLLTQDWKIFHQDAFHLYRALLKVGVAREIARGVLPLTTYTEWYWKIDLHNLLHFLRLRLDPHAQAEIRVYAEAIVDLLTPIWPHALGVLNNGKV